LMTIPYYQPSIAAVTGITLASTKYDLDT